MKTYSARLLSVLLAFGPVLSAVAHAGGSVAATEEGLGIYVSNPYYWQYHGRPVLLLGGSSGPSGALNDEGMFLWPNLPAALDRLKAAGGNYVRCLMSGRLRETTLWPFARQGDRYDLDQWDEEYWRLFETFLRETQARGIITDIELWATFDYHRAPWARNPFNPKNNVNYTAAQTGLPVEVPSHPSQARNSFFRSLPDLNDVAVVLKYQQRFVDKILSYTLQHDHVLYCMDNETTVSPKWGAYWANYVHTAAARVGRKVPVTEMFDPHDLSHPMHSNVIDHPEVYDFIELAQNNHQKGETHYAKIMEVRRRIAASPRPLNNVKIYGVDGGQFGSSQEAMRRFWRNLFAGCASARFHEKHLGDSEPALRMIRSARLMTAVIDPFRCQPHNDLLSDREPNEAYCLAEPGKQYAVYFPAGGSVRLDLTGCTGEVELCWLVVDSAKRIPLIQRRSIQENGLDAPGPGQWIAVLTAAPKINADAGRAARASAPGLLRVHPTNPRYFTDGTKNADGALKAIYLTGSHTWNNLVDMDKADPPAPFDFEAYLDFLQRYGHNFIRLWTWDSVTWDSRANGKIGKDFVHHVAPLPWARTGPDNRGEGVPPLRDAGILPAIRGRDALATKEQGQGVPNAKYRVGEPHDALATALDGKPKFDLTKFNPEYFDRLRTRVRAAGERGIYVSVMLFEGWGLSHANRRIKTADGWAYRSHPFHPDNNINGITGDLNGDGNVLEVHSLASGVINALQAAYIHKVVDTVNDLDNVLYEVINEGGNQEWDWWVVKTIKDYEQTKPKQHPVGITGHGGERIATMLASPADWISPGGQDGYRDPAPAWEGRKVSLLDTDHIWGVGGNHGWVWRSFLRGHNPIFMDPYDGSILGDRRGEGVPPSNRGQDARDTDKARMASPQFEPLRRNMGHTLRYARKVNLAAMTPQGELASTGFCLADPGKEYLVYLPEGGEATVDLSAVSGSIAVEWFNPRSGETTEGQSISGGRKCSFKPPFDGDAVLYLRR